MRATAPRSLASPYRSLVLYSPRVRAKTSTGFLASQPCVHIATQAPFHETWGESFKVAASIAQGQRLDLPELAASSMRRVNARITQGQRLSSPGQWPPVSRPTSGLFEVNQGENRKTRGRNKQSTSSWIIRHTRFANFLLFFHSRQIVFLEYQPISTTRR